MIARHTRRSCYALFGSFLLCGFIAGAASGAEPNREAWVGRWQELQAKERPDGEPWDRNRTTSSNDNVSPGSSGVDEGYVTGEHDQVTAGDPPARYSPCA